MNDNVPVIGALAASREEAYDTIEVASDPQGHVTNKTVVAFSEEDAKRGFTNPFVLILGESFDRTTFHDSVVRLLRELPQMQDKRLKDRFISWYCEMFRQPNSAFYTEDHLEKSVEEIDESLRKITGMEEKRIESIDWPKVVLEE